MVANPCGRDCPRDTRTAQPPRHASPCTAVHVLARQLFDPGIYSVSDRRAAIGVGWKLNFYTGGTTTPITTYNARTAGSANANPVIADANGRFDDIWIAESQTIKWVLTDANDVVKATVDDYLVSAATPVDAALVTFLAASAPLPIANGGTNATSAANAAASLAVLPTAGGTMTGNIIRSFTPISTAPRCGGKI
jgi:hypothetical protein